MTCLSSNHQLHGDAISHLVLGTWQGSNTAQHTTIKPADTHQCMLYLLMAFLYIDSLQIGHLLHFFSPYAFHVQEISQLVEGLSYAIMNSFFLPTESLPHTGPTCATVASDTQPLFMYKFFCSKHSTFPYVRLPPPSLYTLICGSILTHTVPVTPPSPLTSDR